MNQKHHIVSKHPRKAKLVSPDTKKPMEVITYDSFRLLDQAHKAERIRWYFVKYGFDLKELATFYRLGKVDIEGWCREGNWIEEREQYLKDKHVDLNVCFIEDHWQSRRALAIAAQSRFQTYAKKIANHIDEYGLPHVQYTKLMMELMDRADEHLEHVINLAERRRAQIHRNADDNIKYLRDMADDMQHFFGVALPKNIDKISEADAAIAAAKQEEMFKAKSRVDLECFAKRYFSHYMTKTDENGDTIRIEPPKIHKEAYAFWTHQMLMRDPGDEPKRVATEIAAQWNFKNTDSSAWVWPRGFAKTTLVMIFALWCALTERRKFILVVSGGDSEAKLMLGNIKHELEDNELLKADFGDQQNKDAWSQSQITLLSGCCIFARSLWGNLRGIKHEQYRPDMIILDDIEDDASVATFGQREKVFLRVMKAVIPLGKKGECIYVYPGTLLHADSLLAKVVNYRGLPTDDDQFSSWHRSVRKAIVADGEGNKVSAWPEYWDLTDLIELRVMLGSRPFNTEYQNNPISDDDSRFPLEWLDRARDRGESEQFCFSPPDERKYALILTAVDPAIAIDRTGRSSKDSDWSVVQTWGLRPDFDRQLLRGIRLRGQTPDMTIRRIIEEADICDSRYIVIEDNAFQVCLELDIRSKTSRKVFGMTTGREKRSPYVGLPALEALYENGKVILPYGDVREREYVNILCGELHGIGSEAHDDMVMCQWIAEKRLRQAERWLRKRMEACHDLFERGEAIHVIAVQRGVPAWLIEHWRDHETWNVTLRSEMSLGMQDAMKRVDEAMGDDQKINDWEDL